MWWALHFAVSAEKYIFYTIYIYVTVRNKSCFSLEGEPKVSTQKYMHKICGCFLVSGSLPSDLTHLF